ncbi:MULTISPECIES: alanine racemase [Phenylobacterium]|uniref:Alanine racemase n=1 Tax=Phenylobacterium koreense TaxID=266125 RepID=A0ABV2EJV2_9CAUL
MPFPTAARLTIDLDALARNLAVLRIAAGGAQAAPVIKADGYGLGAGPIGRRLWAEGCKAFFVARLSEGESLRAELGPNRPATIYVLDGFIPGAGSRLIAADLTPVLASLPQIDAASAFAAAQGRALPVALQVDTGMNRQGLALDEAKALAASPDRLRHLDVRLLMSHLGSATDPADARNALQRSRFDAIRPLFPKAQASFAASAGIMLGPDYRAELIRPGISLYGGGPEERPDDRLEAVATFEAPILYIRSVAPGEIIGYGSSVVATRPMRLAIIAAGYADGIIRSSGKGGGYAWFAGARRPLVIVTMDLIAIDIGDDPAAIGQYVELLGENVPIDEAAEAAGTVAHECLVRLGGRAERVYVGAV